MSKALRYLAATRPEAATNLLGFYKHSVQALDDKTRHLIQIVTKISVGTERGLRQYAPKALKAGATKEEILDAVLMAFPAAGLNKVLDAIVVLNELELLPEVPDAEPAPAADPVLGALTDFPIKKMQCVSRATGDVIVYRPDETSVKVYDNHCSHARTSLCKGIDHGEQVECRIHNWVFDLASGKCVGPDPAGKPSLREVPAEVRDGQVVVTG
ncbi:Rieske 2Fe-2S domain-containing protein [Magnetofaba australis]|uniref:Putative carboxymuconolactone decarboxylase n=1 Tax=Magnetofaba australis IT-1 TaxID=1434232 RepID=A0A1Y2K9A7_9PROT|nr:Rieske 2Fe-2S domain-containing protein [Magnetofaba australis]OSM07077.1 putative carboxymuconolactone decarboxylase [Magnetofaba australis IT-1]